MLRPNRLPGWGGLLAAGGALLLLGLLVRAVFAARQGPEPPLPPADSEDRADHREVEPERRDVRVRSILLFGGALVIFLGVVLVLVTVLQGLATGRWPDLATPPNGLGQPEDLALPPAPRLEAIPGETLAEVRAAEAALLGEYAWIDREAGVVRVPIERAMQLVAERGLPVAPGAENVSFEEVGPLIPLESSSGRVLEELSP